MANVSRGTVDRVLHERGKISKKAYDKVIAVLREIKYQPNLIARSLKTHKSRRLAVLIPDYTKDAYWLPCVKGIQQAANEYEPFGIIMELHYFDPHNSKLFFGKGK